MSHCLKKTINELRRGEIEIAEARTRGFLLNILMTAIKDSQIDERLKALEEELKEQKEYKEMLNKRD